MQLRQHWIPTLYNTWAILEGWYGSIVPDDLPHKGKQAILSEVVLFLLQVLEGPHDHSRCTINVKKDRVHPGRGNLGCVQQSHFGFLFYVSSLGAIVRWLQIWKWLNISRGLCSVMSWCRKDSWSAFLWSLQLNCSMFWAKSWTNRRTEGLFVERILGAPL